MNLNLRANKQAVRAFMAAQYTDAKLVALLGHARSGQLAYRSCCCFIAIPTANHELQGERQGFWFSSHYATAHKLPGALPAEYAYFQLAFVTPREPSLYGDDALRRRLLIPMILSEMRRRRMSMTGGFTPANAHLGATENV